MSGKRKSFGIRQMPKIKEEREMIVFKRFYKSIAVPIYKVQGNIAKKFVAHAYKKLFYSEWCIDNPEQFNHDIDLYYLWPTYNIPHWLERGVYNLIAIKQYKNPILIELCCGEGFNTTRFYSKSCKKILACDFDRVAIKEAKKNYSAPNVVFKVADIRKEIPAKVDGFAPTNIIWDAAIEHFTVDEIDKIMGRLQKILCPKKGILSGQTIVECKKGKSLAQHEYEFADKEDLKRFFTPYFKNVIVWETIYEDRHNLYFMASDGKLPFTKDWEHWTTTF